VLQSFTKIFEVLQRLPWFGKELDPPRLFSPPVCVHSGMHFGAASLFAAATRGACRCVCRAPRARRAALPGGMLARGFRSFHTAVCIGVVFSVSSPVRGPPIGHTPSRSKAVASSRSLHFTAVSSVRRSGERRRRRPGIPVHGSCADRAGGRRTYAKS